MSDLKKWRVTGPNGFEFVCELNSSRGDEINSADWALEVAADEHKLWHAGLMRQAGYRAEPIKEPKMVTVRAEDVEAVSRARPASMYEIEAANIRLRAALDGGK